jgi:Leucine-rich repeat (LRR) protein
MIKILSLFVFLALFIPPVHLKAQLPLPDTNRVYINLEEALKNPEQVYHLKLSHKKLGIFPEEISRLINLRSLNLSKNKIIFIPPFIGNFPHLRKLDLSSNKIELLPSEIGHLTELETLVLSQNDIDSIPTEMASLKNLRRIELWDTSVSAFPEEMGKLENLTYIEMRGIMLNDEDQQKIIDLFPSAKIFFSPSCNCKY